MQETSPRSLSTQFPPLLTFLESCEQPDEKLEDQLDRLNSSVQQVLAGAIQLQQEQTTIPLSPHTVTHTRENSEICLEGTCSDYTGEKSEDEVDDESQEIIEYLANMIEKAEMESEDLRSLSLRSEEEHRTAMAGTEGTHIRTLADLLGVKLETDCTIISLAALITEALRPKITCTMEQLCAAETSLFALLQDPSKDTQVALPLGQMIFSLKVLHSDTDVLTASKKRICENVSQALKTEEGWGMMEPEEEWVCSPFPEPIHTECERQIEELQLKLKFMKEQIIPEEIYRQVEQEKLKLMRTEHIRKQEIDELLSAKEALGALRSELKTQVDEARILKELLITEQMNASDLRTRLTQERLQLQEKTKFVDSEKLQVAREKSNFLNFANFQGSEMMTLKQKIERLVKSGPQEQEDVQSIPESLPDGDLRELDLRIKQMQNLIASENGSVESIQRELNDIENTLAGVNQRRGGVRRVKTQLASAKNKLMTLKSKQAIAGADRMMSSLNSTIQALEKTWKPPENKEKAKPTQSTKSEQVTKPAAPGKKNLSGLKLEEPRGWSTPVKLLSVPQPPTPLTEIKDPYSHWLGLSDTIKSHEATITQLRKDLNHATHRLKHIEARELRQAEKEGMLKVIEKKMEFMGATLEKRNKTLNVKDANLKRRELAVLAAADADDRLEAAKTMLEEMETNIKIEESQLEAGKKELDQEKGSLVASREEVASGKKYLSKMQRALAKENVRVEKEKKKLETMQQDITRLLPSLQTLLKPMAK